MSVTPQFPTGSPEQTVVESASRTVFAVANARIRGDVDDGLTVFAGYLEEALAAGVTLPMAWTLLASAAINEFTAAIELVADLQEAHPETTLAEAAMAHALEALS